jgi:hypothetical protein
MPGQAHTVADRLDEMALGASVPPVAAVVALR